jgi:hypothetical protein
MQQKVIVCSKLRVEIVRGSPIPPISNELETWPPQNDVPCSAASCRPHAEDNGENGLVTMKNQNGVVVHVVSPIKGRKFHLTGEGLDVQLKK